jgi:hypothetical protein
MLGDNPEGLMRAIRYLQAGHAQQEPFTFIA